MRVLARDGYAGAPADAIAAEARFTVGALHSNFATKGQDSQRAALAGMTWANVGGSRILQPQAGRIGEFLPLVLDLRDGAGRNGGARGTFRCWSGIALSSLFREGP